MAQYQGKPKDSGGFRNDPPRTRVSREDLSAILDGNAQMLVRTAEGIAKNDLTAGRNKVTTSQIRNIFGAVKTLEAKGSADEKIINRLILLKPKLAYIAGRNREVSGLEVLRDVLSEAIDLVDEKKERFAAFCQFFEAILAYHKAHGGK